MSLPNVILPDEFNGTQRDISYRLSCEGILVSFFREDLVSRDGYSIKCQGNPVIRINASLEDEVQKLVAFRELAFIRLGFLDRVETTLDIPPEKRLQALREMSEKQSLEHASQ
ncbi:hypothetical protein [Brevibacillus brevis]|uniref:Uncharacterized protein n=1 Tax=Brevibacillus brevis TaxID=1393 RepID=A0ABY9TCR3_BREBE|nr:hypothetical protein [Brevibacillus brevis]WNC17895.1 hypothetical protein RGB73_30465 [Brevibacillus brevis]